MKRIAKTKACVNTFGSNTIPAEENPGAIRIVPNQPAAKFWLIPENVLNTASRVFSITSIITFLIFIFPTSVYAITKNEPEGCILEVPNPVDPTKPYTGIPSIGCLAQIIASVVNFAFMFLGAAALLYLLYGAIRFVISRGDQKALQSARNTMTYAVIGTVFILLSFAIIQTIFKVLGVPSVLENFTLYQK